MVFSKIYGLLACLATVVVSTNTWYYEAGVLNGAPFPSDNFGFNDAPKSTINQLSSIGDSEFTALTHPQFPNHRVRIKKSNFCDPTVKLALVYHRPSPTIALMVPLLAAFTRDTLTLMQVLSICFSISSRVVGIQRKVCSLFVNHSYNQFAHELFGR